MSASRRAILEAILFGDMPQEKLKAAELLEAMDARDPDAAHRDFYAELDGMTAQELAELDEAFAVPVVTVEERAEEIARDPHRRRALRRRGEARGA